MKTAPQYFGLYDMKGKRLLWKMPIHRAKSWTPPVDDDSINQDHICVWVHYPPVLSAKYGPTLVSVLTGDLVTMNYHPPKPSPKEFLRLSALGANLLRKSGYKVHPCSAIDSQMAIAMVTLIEGAVWEDGKVKSGNAIYAYTSKV